MSATAGRGLRRREGKIALVAAILAVLALLTVFAIELANTQAKSKRDVESRVHERGVLAAALIDSLFSSVLQEIPQDVKLYGARKVHNKLLDRNQQTSTYLALVSPSGKLLAHSHGFTPQARRDLKQSAALALVRSGLPYGIGNVLPYGRSGVINIAVGFPTRYGPRVLLSGITPSELGLFIGGDLKEIPGVDGSRNYLLDGNGIILGSTNPALPVGRAAPQLAQVGDRGGHYSDEVTLKNSTWRIVLTAPDGPLFATVSGLRKWVPWIIFIAFALVALLAVMLALRVLRAADQVAGANSRLSNANRELESVNEALDRRARELARSNSELEQFASIASHDLQEPLRKVRTFTQQLNVTDGDRVSEKGKDYIERASNAAERMQRLIDDLLKYSRVSTHGRPFAQVNMAAVVHEVLQDLEVQVSMAGATVEVGELPTINGDYAQMRHLTQNLISNALKFRREGVPAHVEISATTDDDTTQIVVSDNGIGFDPKYSGRIFRVFERLNSRAEYPGTGIGLALSRKIVERHGGTITADSAPGQGAKFLVTLPLHQPEEVLVIDAASNGSREEAHVPV